MNRTRFIWYTGLVSIAVLLTSFGLHTCHKRPETGPVAVDRRKTAITGGNHIDALNERALEFNRLAGNGVLINGVVLDQNEEPVVGTVLNFGVGFFDSRFPLGGPKYEQNVCVTDSRGRFTIKHPLAVSIDIYPKATEIYEFRPEVISFDLRVGKPEFAELVVIRAYRIDGANRLAKSSLVALCEGDGRNYYIDLINGKSGEGPGPGLRVSVRRPSGVLPRGGYDWSVEFGHSEWEVLETKDVFMYLAPKSGYSPIWSLKMESAATSYARRVKRRFYLRSANGMRYGRLEIEFMSDYRDKFGLRLYYWLGKTGSVDLR